MIHPPAVPLVWLDGEIVASADAVVSVHDRAFRSGEGVFETLRAYGNHPFRVGPHVQRAVAGARAIGIDLDPTLLLRAITEVIAANSTIHDGADSVVRLTASAGEIDPASAFPGSPATGRAGEPTIVVTSHRLRLDPDLATRGVTAVCVPMMRELPQVKAVSYLVAVTARNVARERGADEAVFTTADGDVLEAASANLAAIHGGTLITPPVASGVLAGVTRSVLLEIADDAGLRVEERRLTREEVLGADEAVLTASTREVIPLVSLDGQAIGTGRPGPRSAALREAYRREVARERAEQANG